MKNGTWKKNQICFLYHSSLYLNKMQLEKYYKLFLKK